MYTMYAKHEMGAEFTQTFSMFADGHGDLDRFIMRELAVGLESRSGWTVRLTRSIEEPA